MKITQIRIRRIITGMTTEEAIESLKISKSSFYKIEQGCITPSPQILARMANIYKCTIDEIFNDLGITG